MTIKDYCIEFQKRLKKVEVTGTKLADCVTAYRLLKSANLLESQEQLIKATTKMTYKDISAQMKKIFVTEIQGSSEVRVKEEPIEQDTLFGHQSRHFNNDSWRSRKSGYKGPAEQGKSWNDWTGKGAGNQSGADDRENRGYKKRGKNPPDQYGRVSRCLNCDSVNHWIKDCPDLSKEEDTYLAECQQENHSGFELKL